MSEEEGVLVSVLAVLDPLSRSGRGVYIVGSVKQPLGTL